MTCLLRVARGVCLAASGCVAGNCVGLSSVEFESCRSYDSASRMSWLDTGQAPAV